jgi:hypothetical protein
VPGDDGSGAVEVPWAGDAGPREVPPVDVPGADADAAGEADADAAAEPPGDGASEPGGRPAADGAAVPEPVPAGSPTALPPGGDASPSGVAACRGSGSSVETPGWRIGAIGGFFGSGWGVRPDVHA